ncbi:unnamed protein product, partial [Meganyctiphanes norvegica]
ACPDGFITSQDLRQCFKVFKDEHRNWNETQSKCLQENLVHAMPSDTNAIELRKKILDTYGEVEGVWLGGISPAGSGQVTVPGNQTQLDQDHHLWRPGAPVLSDDQDMCVWMPLTQEYVSDWPRQVYSTRLCAFPWITLCEATFE